MSKEELVLFESSDGSVSLPVQVEEDTVWLTQAQMAELFEKERSVVTKHINNAFKEGEVDRKSNVQNLHIPSSDRPVTFYNLDVIISVGYRVKSQRGIEFRRWATGVLRRYIVEGQAINARRLEQLAEVTHVMARIPESLETRQVLDIVKSYTAALNLLDDYDHQRIASPKGSKDVRALGYQECRRVIDGMHFGDESDLFGVEKDDSFKGTVGNIYQSFGGQEVYPSLQEKAANLLYLVVKNHSFLDGNKRIAATMFLYFLDCNDALFSKSGKAIDDSTLVAITIMIAESKPEEKDAMVALVMNFLALG